jgi:acyl carrier protein
VNSKKVESVVLDIFSTVLKRNVDIKDSRITLSQWDSLKHIEIIFAIEDELNIQFEEEEIEQLDDIEKFIKIASVKYAS